MQSCTSGRNAFFTGMYPLRTGMIPPQLPGSPSYLQPGTPALAVFLSDLGYTTGEFGKNHLGDHTAIEESTGTLNRLLLEILQRDVDRVGASIPELETEGVTVERAAA
jgi:arylsulfatase A-like enzyme